jgi:peptide-methionine (R)-S-oxide reductase
MDSSKQLMLLGSVVVLAAAAAGIVVTSQSTTSATTSPQRTQVMPRKSDRPDQPADPKDDEWKAKLTDEQFKITRRKGTEPPFTGKYWNHKGHGVYRCVCCKTPLFESDTKFDSGTGWPSFYQPIEESRVDEVLDFSLFTQRTEVICHNCKAHLGHRFDDAPSQPTGLRYCINSAALDFQDKETKP